MVEGYVIIARKHEVQRTQLVGVLEIHIVVAGLNIHGESILKKRIQEVFTVSSNTLYVKVLAVLTVVTVMDDMINAIFLHIREEAVLVKASLIINEHIRGVTHAHMRVIQNDRFRHLL